MLILPVPRCFVTTKAGDLRDDACGKERAGGNGSFHVDAVYGYTLGIDDGSGLDGAGAEVRWGTEECLCKRRLHDDEINWGLRTFGSNVARNLRKPMFYG